MGALLLGILCRSSWQTQLQLLKTMFPAVSPKSLWGWCSKFARVVLESFRLLVRWGYALVWVRLVILTASVCWLMLKKWGYFTYCWMGIRRKPRFSRSLAQAWSEHKALLTLQTQIIWRLWHAINFLANASMAIKHCAVSNSEHPEERHPLVSLKRSPGLSPKVLVQIFMIFAELSLWLFKTVPRSAKALKWICIEGEKQKPIPSKHPILSVSLVWPCCPKYNR